MDDSILAYESRILLPALWKYASKYAIVPSPGTFGRWLSYLKPALLNWNLTSSLKL
jgi:hypothetical protein